MTAPNKKKKRERQSGVGRGRCREAVSAAQSFHDQQATGPPTPDTISFYIFLS
jgi:hypothetical protein